MLRRGSFRFTTIASTALCAVALAWSPTPPATPPVHHVFILMLENESYDMTFGAKTPAPYLGRTLPAEGALLRNYHGIGHASLDNYVALVSGQAPNTATQGDCFTYTEFQLARATLDVDGQAIGTGCVYPPMVHMIGDQLEAAHLTWKGYMEDLGNDPRKEVAACGHPAIGQKDGTNQRSPHDQYAMRHNPFFYFHSVIDDPARCALHVVNLPQLATDLAHTATTPNYVFVTPNVCNDGHDAPCVDGAPGGLVQADKFLTHWVPIITQSPAFKTDGVLIITFDEGLDNAACCNEQPLPGQPHPPGYNGPGGGRVGAVILSRFVKPGTVSDTPYNHYSLLRWAEDVFHVPHLGYAGGEGLATFGSDVFSETKGAV
jgi:phosphatidylinositol-3-phosphatase